MRYSIIHNVADSSVEFYPVPCFDISKSKSGGFFRRAVITIVVTDFSPEKISLRFTIPFHLQHNRAWALPITFMRMDAPSALERGRGVTIK